MYESNAKGLFVPGSRVVTSAELVGKDFAILESGAALHPNIQTVYDAKIPAIYFKGLDPYKMSQNVGLDPDHWDLVSGFSADLDQVMKDLFSGEWDMDGMRTVHGIMFDVSVYDASKRPSSAWVVGYANWMFSAIWDKTREYGKALSQYLYASYDWLEGKNPVYTGKDKETVQTLFYVTQKNISTTFKCAVDANGLPAVTKPKLVYDDSSACPWCFWLYQVKNGMLEVVYNGAKAKLYGELGFATSGGNTGGGSGSDAGNTGGDTGDTGDSEYVTLDLTPLINVLERLADSQEDMADSLDRLVEHFGA